MEGPRLYMDRKALLRKAFLRPSQSYMGVPHWEPDPRNNLERDLTWLCPSRHLEGGTKNPVVMEDAWGWRQGNQGRLPGGSLALWEGTRACW